MGTGSGTGTPVTSQGSATLSSLRDRVQTLVQGASGHPEPLSITVSSKTLANIRDRVELTLQDTGNNIWAEGDIDEALTQAIETYSQNKPQHKIGTLTVSTAGREHSLSTLTGIERVEKIWWDYDSNTPGYPPNWRQFEVWPGSILHIDDDEEPAVDDVIRVWYTLKHTLNGLDGAGATTIPNESITTIVTGGAYYAALQRAVELSEQATVDKEVVKRLMTYANEQGVLFRRDVRKRDPAWQRRARGYAQEDTDEAIRWALHRYNEINPAKTITTLTLSASGREIDISSITGYHQIERVWWDYDSSDPAHPPNWRNFELWPGDILYVNDPQEPTSGDVVRIWYTHLQTINGLDSASTTTVPTNHETLIVVGASGYATQEREQDTEAPRQPTKLARWAEANLKEFERGLARLSTEIGTLASGIANGPDLDRWDAEGTGWW